MTLQTLLIAPKLRKKNSAVRFQALHRGQGSRAKKSLDISKNCWEVATIKEIRVMPSG
jgi:hypothetical protein